MQRVLSSMRVELSSASSLACSSGSTITASSAGRSVR